MLLFTSKNLMQSIPREVYIAKDGRQLVQWPVEEIKRLHGEHTGFQDKKLKGNSLLEIPVATASQVRKS